MRSKLPCGNCLKASWLSAAKRRSSSRATGSEEGARRMARQPSVLYGSRGQDLLTVFLHRQPLASGLVVSRLYQRLCASALAAKITRYAIGSVIALITSVVVFALLYVMIGNTTICSVAAFVAGAVPNWILNRRWAWQVRGRVEFMREIVGYLIVSILALVASSAATGWVNSQVKGIPAGHGLRVILVTAAYVAVQAVLFAAKFVVYEHWVFAGRSRFRAAVRSRHQVWTAARANRTP
jgi:putative flippase GtrA